MLVGDGIGKTVVKASRNVVDGWTTFQSATFGAFSSNFPLLSTAIVLAQLLLRFRFDIHS